MSFDLPRLVDAVQRYRKVARVLVVGTKGSAPRDVGASMLVWAEGQSGTIGGGTLEYQAAEAARAGLLTADIWHRALRHVPLGPALGQCCGGSVSLLTEVFSDFECAVLQSLAQTHQVISRPIITGLPADGAASGRPVLANGWVSEDLAQSGPPIWIYGAGHVGRALVRILPPLGFEITWVDKNPARFPPSEQVGVARFVSENPADAVAYAPPDARHLVMTYSHALDLEICHRILSHGFCSAGLIGSKTKWARFRKRLLALGHTPAQIARITCPIGMPELGKAPENIALGVATEVLKETVVGKSGQKPKEFAV